MYLMEIPGNTKYLMTKEKTVLTPDNSVPAIIANNNLVSINLYNTGEKLVDLDWLYLVCLYKLKMPIGYEYAINLIKFKPMKQTTHHISDAHAVILSSPVYHKSHKEFRMIPRFPNYFINSNGDVYYESTGNMLLRYKPPHRHYPMVGIRDQSGLFKQRNQLVHRLVGYTWVENDNFMEKNIIDHIDGNKMNCSATNLRWVSRAENNEYAIEQNLNTGCVKVVTRNIETGEIKEHFSVTKAAKYMGRSRLTIPAGGLKIGIVWVGKNGKFEMKKWNDKTKWSDYINNGLLSAKLKVRKNTRCVGGGASLSGYMATNGVKIFRAKSIDDLADQTGLVGSTISKYLLKKKSYNEWKFKVNDNTDDFSMVADFKGPENKPKQIKITNTLTGEIIISDSMRQAAKLTNTDKRIIAYRLKNPYKYKNNTYIYELLSNTPL